MKSVIAFVLVCSSFAFAQEPTSTPTETLVPAVQAELASPAELPVAEAPSLPVSAITNPAPVKKEEGDFPKFEYKAYGYISLTQHETFKTVQNLEPIVRRKMDLAEFAFEGEFHLTENSKVEFEVEIEHGGVGTTIEFDPFEEFGEFEQEIEKGGEVVLNEVFYKKTFNNTTLKVGKFPVYISLGSILTKPHRYPTILASDLEGRMIPLGWTETGVQLERKLGPFTARAGVVTALNSEFFRTYSWVGGGYQRHFETMNADELATLLSIELGSVAKGSGVALAAYRGNSSANRYKMDKLKDSAQVEILTLMGNYKYGNFGISGEWIQGELENSDKVATANASLAGLAKPKAFAPLGSKAVLQAVQLSYDFDPDLTIYTKHEHVNTFADVEGNINKNPRYDVTRKSAGLMWMWDTAAFMKVQYAREKTELFGLPETYQASIAFGFDLDRFEN